ncbi:MAG: hypothetical protein R3E65_04665 [Steroidobacteraceae bacterium]
MSRLPLLVLLLAATTPLNAAPPTNDPHPFWRGSQGLWRAAADYYGADGTHQLRDYGQLSRVTITAGRLFLEDSAFYPPGGTYNAAYSLGLADANEGVEVRNTQSGEIAADGSVVLDRSDLPLGTSVRTRLAPIDARRALQTGDKPDGTRAYEAYWSLTAPGRRLRLLAGIDPVAKDGGPPGPGALRALATYRDTALPDDDEASARAELRRKQSVAVLRHAVLLDGTLYDIAERVDVEVTDCDRRASDPDDPERVVVFGGTPPPLAGGALAAALAACRDAVRARADTVRLQRIVARLEALQPP